MARWFADNGKKAGGKILAMLSFGLSMCATNLRTIEKYPLSWNLVEISVDSHKWEEFVLCFCKKFGSNKRNSKELENLENLVEIPEDSH